MLFYVERQGSHIDWLSYSASHDTVVDVVEEIIVDLIPKRGRRSMLYFARVPGMEKWGIAEAQNLG